MSLARAEQSALDPTRRGGALFVAAAQQAEVRVDLRARRFLVATASVPETGRLRQVIDDAVEGALALRGAFPPSVGVDATVEATIRDQVFRARALGAAGLVVAFPPLWRSMMDRRLGVDDSAVLLSWVEAARHEPVVLLFDEADRDGFVMAPVALGDLLPSPGREQVRESAVPPSGEVEKVAVAEEKVDEEEEAPTQRFVSPPPPPVIAMPQQRRGVLKKRPRAVEEVVVEAPVECPPVAQVPAVAPVSPVAPVEVLSGPRSSRRGQSLEAALSAALTEEAPVVPRSSRRVDVGAREVLQEVAPPVPASTREREREVELEAPPVVEARTRRVVNAAEWRSHAVELDKARGPKPVAVIEKLFTARYMPLLGAVSRGEADGSVRAVVDGWRTNFEHSYREAFAALRVTGKRPPMVFDAPEVAAKIARLNGARATKLLLVDGMRFDLGERVSHLLGEKLSGRAVCVDRSVLWAALPATTKTQMTLLARGAEGLRELDLGSVEAEPEPEVMRGRALAKLRRERVGSREVMKLELVEGRLRMAGPGYEERLEGLAEEVAEALLRYMETLPPRTLLFIFGDHGFRLPVSPDGRSTGPATQGGISPEEVLMPGHAWLLGGVH